MSMVYTNDERRCEGTVASLAALLALAVSEDFVPDENIDRTGKVPAKRHVRDSA